MRKLLLHSTALLLLGAASAFAADMPKPVPPTTDLSKAATGEYKLEKGHSTILFGYSHLGYSTYFVRVNDFDATLEFKPAAPETSSITVTIDTDSLDSNNDAMDDKFDSAEFFDVDTFPEAKFVSTRLQKLNDAEGKLYGNLTLHGVTKPIVLDITFNGYGTNPITQAPSLGFSALGKIKRSDFGLGAYVPLVGDEVSIIIETEFVMEPPKKGA
jgi:polyisoprenoid-binding protein YceI